MARNKLLQTLSDKQRRMLNFIQERHQQTGVYPSVREIAAHMDFKSTNTVDYHLRKLESLGVLERGGRRARTFQMCPALRHGSVNQVLRAGIPLVGRVAAGTPILAEQNYDGLVNLYSYFRSDDQTFALRVQGDSMINAGILDGDIVIVRQQSQIANGEIGVATIGDEATVKRIYDEGSFWRLQPENPRLEPVLVQKGQKLFQIAGKVVGVIRKM